MANSDRTPVDDKRQAFTAARTTRLQAQAGLAAKNTTLATLSRTLPADDPQVRAAGDAVRQQQQIVGTARRAEKAASLDITSALRGWLATDPTADIGRLYSSYPIVLLPVRIETRFVAEQSELRVRIYPDEVSAD